jgi:hypothetical protein
MVVNEGSMGVYEIRVEAHLDGLWVDWFEGMALAHQVDGTATLTGPLADQSALFGVLERVRDLGCVLISVRRLA